ncbi:hypothetical protein CCR75_003654 [Bremia lactucae]|uniref:Fanconi-associated nuclease n=1 Tax=Bremia lactucae TaxID=4779 RepID=A0A976P094_BRELC|nr:hypothetical protein CCR75_003654 [Bremia lactucae]
MDKFKQEETSNEPIDAAPVWEDAYARHIKLVVSTILHDREDFRALLSADEIAIASRFLTDFQPFEQQLYARLLQRQGPWFRISSLLRYFNQTTQLVTNQQVQDVVHAMIHAHFFQSFPMSLKKLSPSDESTHIDTTLQAIESCASAPELALLYTKMTGSKKHRTKTDVLAAIAKVVKTQRRIDGSRIPLASLMHQIWLDAR